MAEKNQAPSQQPPQNLLASILQNLGRYYVRVTAGKTFRSLRFAEFCQLPTGIKVILPTVDFLYNDLQGDIKRYKISAQKLWKLLDEAQNAVIATDHCNNTGVPGYLYYKNNHLWVYVPSTGEKMVLYQDEGNKNQFIFIRYFKDEQEEYQKFLCVWEGAFASVVASNFYTSKPNSWFIEEIK